MQYLKSFIVIMSLAFAFAICQPTNVVGQCAMCSLNAENSTQNGNEQGKGLNDGILFLLAMPFLIGGGVAILWYNKFRAKEENKAPIF